MNDLSSIINIILEEETANSSGSVSAANELARRLEDRRREMLELQNSMQVLQKKICGELALHIRRRMPILSISVSNGCKVGFKSKVLSLSPDISRGVWNIRSSDPKFANRFMKRYGTRTVISDSLDDLAKAVVDYFSSHYKSLGEDLTRAPDGVILIENKKRSIVDLARWLRS
jgi:hypothetical protein